MKTTKVLLYCTKGKPYLYRDLYSKWRTTNQKTAIAKNGYILAECEVEVEKIVSFRKGIFCMPTLNAEELLDKSCLTNEQLSEYLKDGCGYALHIKKLKTFDSKPLIDYGVNKAPQNMMRVYKDGPTYILISVRPEWLCKILNHKKTIEVRKKVLKEMLYNE